MTEKVSKDISVRAPEYPRRARIAEGEVIANTCPVAEAIIRSFKLSPEEARRVRVCTAVSYVPGYEPYQHPARLTQWIRDHDEAAVRSLEKWCKTPPKPARFRMTLTPFGLQDTSITMAEKVSLDV